MVRDSNPIGKRVILYEPRLSIRELCRKLPKYIQQNRTMPHSLIICPIADHVIQVDDCVGDSLERIRPYVSNPLPRHLRAITKRMWSYLKTLSKLERTAIRSRLLPMLPGVDRSASGPMRWPGSINHKPERNGFSVRIVESHPGRYVRIGELEAAGLLSPLRAAAKEELAPVLRFPAGAKRGFTFPDYERCLREAPCKQDGSPNASIADKNWAILALDRGIPAEKVEARLRELRDKAMGRPDYAQRTVSYAVSVVSRSYRSKYVG